MIHIVLDMSRFLSLAAVILATSAIGVILPSGTAHAKSKIASYAIFLASDDPPGTRKKLKQLSNLAAKGENCAEVTNVAYLPPAQRYSPHKNDPYFATCHAKHKRGVVDFYNVYFSDTDLQLGKVKNQVKPTSKSTALILCKKAIKERLKYPSSAEFSAFSAQVSDNGTNNRGVRLNFTALNGLGNRVPKQGKCIVEPKGRTEVTLLNR